MDYWRAICHMCSGDIDFDNTGNEFTDVGCCMSLCGRPDIGFHLLEHIHMSDGVETHRKVGVEAALASFPNCLNRIIRQRPDIAGLRMDRTHIMGVVNVTPDSFSDGGEFVEVDAAVEYGLSLLSQGATILDIGGESTRPGADIVSTTVEMARVVPVIRALRAKTDAVISIDTRKARVMGAAVDAGASMINDVSALEFDIDALKVAASLKVPVILMHSLGTPQTMQDDPNYGHALTDVYDYLHARIEVCVAAGINRDLLLVDPGIGFGKTVRHNVELLDGLSLLHGLGVPVLLGCSRKRFIAELSNNEIESDRLGGSIAGALKGASQGGQIVRVHDVAQTGQALAVWFGSFV